MSDGKKYVISQDSSDFICVTGVIPDAILEMRYYSTYNFIGERINGYDLPVALLTGQAVKALKKVSDELVQNGYRIKLYDAYRPQRAVDHFVKWAEDLEDVRMKEIFYPKVSKKDLFSLGLIAAHSSHSRGSTVDLTLFDMAKGRDVDMGGYFDYFAESSRGDYEGITEAQKSNRMFLRNTMSKHGFVPLEEEWWHFTLKEEPFPNTYFDFPIRLNGNDNVKK